MRSKIYCALSLLLFGISFISAQQSCYEQYLRDHNMPFLTTEDADDSYEEFKKTAIAYERMSEEAAKTRRATEHPNPVAQYVQSEPTFLPILLAIDTLTGTCHLLSEDGTILADAQLALVDSTWYMWLSVDPLADKNISSSPYMYCNGNPIMFIDPDGRAWTDADGNEIKDHSPIRAYIFYNPEEFTPQTKAMYERLEKQYGRGAVALSDVTTETEFVQDWSDMKSRKIAEVNINHHGNNQTLILNPTKGEYITSTGNGKSNLSGTAATNVSELPLPLGNLSGAKLNLNTCHSNDPSQHPLKGEQMTLLTSFFRYFPFQSARGTKAGVSYGFQKNPHPQSNRFLWLIPIPGRKEPIWDNLKRGY